MIKNIEIINFKSIKKINLNCKRINIFIGEPNSGKSNILETLALFSFGAYHNFGDAKKFIRFERTSNLFYDEEVAEPILMNIDNYKLHFGFEGGRFEGRIEGEDSIYCQYKGDYTKFNVLSGPGVPEFKFYRFIDLSVFPQLESDFLLPPSGLNLQSLLSTHKDLRKLFNWLCSPTGLTIGLRPQEHKIELVKKAEDAIYLYPFSIVSDTFRRLIFHLTAIQTNKDSILAFEEPEAHAFPHYIKYLAEKIVSDMRGNQYFFTTHNPYFLLTIAEKAFPEDLKIFITYFEDYQTKIKPLTKRNMERLMALDVDVFFDLEKLMSKK